MGKAKRRARAAEREKRLVEAAAAAAAAVAMIKPPTKTKRTTKVFLGALGALAVAIVGGIAAAHYESDLAVVTTPASVVAIPDSRLVDGLRHLLKASVCVENRGWRAGSVQNVSPASPTGFARVPSVEIISVDRGPIAAKSQRPIEIQVMLTQPFSSSDTSQFEFKLQLHDERDDNIGAFNVHGSFTPDSSSQAAPPQVRGEALAPSNESTGRAPLDKALEAPAPACPPQ